MASSLEPFTLGLEPLMMKSTRAIRHQQRPHASRSDRGTVVSDIAALPRALGSLKGIKGIRVKTKVIKFIKSSLRRCGAACMRCAL